MSDPMWCSMIDGRITSVWVGDAGVVTCLPLTEIKPSLPAYAFYGPVMDELSQTGATRTYPIAWPPLEEVRALATTDIDALVAAELNSTDWVVVRASEGYKPAPADVLSRRKLLRDAGNTACQAIAAAKTHEEIIAARKMFLENTGIDGH